MKLLPLDRAVGQIDQQIAFYENQVRLGYMYKIDPGPGATAEIILTDSIGRVFMFSQQPVMVQYLRWLNNIVTEWNWGTSTKIMLNVPAMDIIMQRLPYSIKVNVIALLLSVPLGFIFGIWAALKKNKTTDHVISTGIMVFISVPSFVMITFLMRFFAYGLNWFPTQWPSDNAPDSVRFLGYFIPVAALCFGTIAGFARYTRAELTEVMSSEFLLLARTKGLTASNRHPPRHEKLDGPDCSDDHWAIHWHFGRFLDLGTFIWHSRHRTTVRQCLDKQRLQRRHGRHGRVYDVRVIRNLAG
jgi:ABC-type dipeptide/oligopeptide/nickel transport system permease component